MTGLYNHRHFFTVLGSEIDRARRQNHPLSMVLFDTDGFKSFNDRHGHLAGDKILRRILDALRDEGEATLSIGLVEFKPEFDARQTGSLADEAMYQSKNSGGDRITAFGI